MISFMQFYESNTESLTGQGLSLKPYRGTGDNYYTHYIKPDDIKTTQYSVVKNTFLFSKPEPNATATPVSANSVFMITQYEPAVVGRSGLVRVKMDSGDEGYLYVTAIRKPSVSGSKRHAGAGKGNERNLTRAIRQHLENVGGNGNIILTDGTRKIVVQDVTDVIDDSEHHGDPMSRLKADVKLVVPSGTFNISIKQRDADFWASLNSNKEILEKFREIGFDLAKRGEIEFVPYGKKFRVVPQFTVPFSRKRAIEVMFGSDIQEGSGAIIIQTFGADHFHADEDGLIVKVERLIRGPGDIGDPTTDPDYPWAVLTNHYDKAGPFAPEYPGTVIRAAGPKRALQSGRIILKDLEI